MKRKAKRRKKSPVLIILFLILLVAAAGLAGEYITRRIPTDRKADLDAIYGKEEGTAAIIANHELSEKRALWTLGHAYLPYDVIRKELNGRFYWDPEEELLLYTLPEEVVTADTETAFDGAPVFLIEDGEVYLSLTYVQQYSNISAENFEAPARIVLRTVWGTELVGTLGEEEALRVRGGVRSPVMTVLPPGERVVILEELENWDRVQSADGFVGYIRKSALAGTEEVTETGPYTEPEYTHTDFPQDVCMLWHQVFRSAGNDELAAFIAKKTPVNVICPSWLSMTETVGEIESRGAADYVQTAHEAGMQVWVMLDNVNHEVDLHASLVPTSVRRTLTEKIFEALDSYGADGLNVDIERLPEETGDAYIQFIRELSVECRKRGIILSVDSGMPSGGGTARYHLDEQAEMVDYIVLMAYDEHYPGSDPGSTASLEFVAQGIRDLLAKTAAGRLICGTPFYTRVWTDSADGLTSEAIGMDGSVQYAKDHNMEVVWQEELGQNYAHAEEDGVILQLWLEDEASQDARLRLIRANALKGAAFWKLGMDGSTVWDVIGKYYAAPDAQESQDAQESPAAEPQAAGAVVGS